MRSSDFLSASDRQIVADQQKEVEEGQQAFRGSGNVHVEANGECESSFPTFDGTCVTDGNKGRTARPLARMVAPDYCDGKSSPRCARSGDALPNARHLSNMFHS